MIESILIIFIVYRLSIAITEQSGPFNIFSNIRTKVENKQEWLQEGFSCAECASFWISILAVLSPMEVNPIFLWLGTAGIVVYLLRRS